VRPDKHFDLVALDAHRVRTGANALDSPIRHHDFQRHHVIGGCPVNRNTRPGGIIGDHSAERCARAGGHVRPETKPVRFEEGIELVEHHSGTDAHRSTFEVEIIDLAIVP